MKLLSQLANLSGFTPLEEAKFIKVNNPLRKIPHLTIRYHRFDHSMTATAFLYMCIIIVRLMFCRVKYLKNQPLISCFLFFTLTLLLRLSLLHSMYSVSYTHLDVYKRQEPIFFAITILPFP